MPPPQAPPAHVSSVDQASVDALARLVASQRWLANLRGDLPAPVASDDGRERFLAAMDAFWARPVPWDPGQPLLPLREVFARRLAQVVRDEALLLAGAGLLTDEEHALADRVTRASMPDDDLQFSELLIDGLPYAGAFVVEDSEGSVLLFTSRGGWEGFESFEELIDIVRSRLDDPDAIDITSRVVSTAPFAHLTQGLIQWHRVALEDAWDTSTEATRVDALHDALGLHALLDIHDLVVGEAPSGRRVARSPSGVSGALTQGIRGGARRTAVTTGRVARTRPDAIATRAGGQLVARLALPLRDLASSAADTLFPESFIVRDTVIPSGSQPLDGVFHVDGASYIRQDEHLFQVRYDPSMTSWRLDRAGRLDRHFTGALVERRADGRWQYRRDRGLAGGSGRARPGAIETVSPVPSGWMDYDTLSLEQAHLLRLRLIERLGPDEGHQVFQRMASRQAAVDGTVWLTPTQHGEWTAALANMRAAIPVTSGWADIEPLSLVQTNALRLRLIDAFGRTEGPDILRRMAARPRASGQGVLLTPEQYRIWLVSLGEVMAERPVVVAAAREASDMPPHEAPVDATRPQAEKEPDTTPAVSDFSPDELRRLANNTRKHFGARGTQVHNQLALNIPIDPPATEQETRVWNETRQRMIARRGRPPGPTPNRLRPGWFELTTDLADFTDNELSQLRHRFIDRYGPSGKQAYRALTMRWAGTNEPLSAPQNLIDRWNTVVAAMNDDVASIRAARGPAPPPQGHIPPELMDLSHEEFLTLRVRLKQALGHSPGDRVYRNMLPTVEGTPPIRPVGAQQDTWNRILADIRTARRAIAPAATERFAGRLWRVPDAEWPERLYYYPRVDDLIHGQNGAVMLPFQRLAPDNALGIPLFTARANTPIGDIDPIAVRWVRTAPPTSARSTLGWLPRAVVRIDLRQSLLGTGGDAPAFELYRLGGPDSTAYMLRPTAEGAANGQASAPLWLFDHFEINPRWNSP